MTTATDKAAQERADRFAPRHRPETITEVASAWAWVKTRRAGTQRATPPRPRPRRTAPGAHTGMTDDSVAAGAAQEPPMGDCVIRPVPEALRATHENREIVIWRAAAQFDGPVHCGHHVNRGDTIARTIDGRYICEGCAP